MAVLVAAEVADSQSRALPCPTSAELEAELVRAGVVGVALPEIETARDRMRVELRGRDGMRVGSREVELPRTCHERATVAAVLVATWMGFMPAPSPEVARMQAAQPPDLSTIYRTHVRDVARWAERLAGPGFDLPDLVHEED